MNAILVLAHGSRATETEATLEAVVGMVREMLPDMIIESAYMEFGKVNITIGLDRLATKGATDIKIIPYFLFEGIHIREDIPHEIEKYRAKRPELNITLGKVFGADKRLAEILKERILSS